jgi:hypothetical protein
MSNSQLNGTTALPFVPQELRLDRGLTGINPSYLNHPKLYFKSLAASAIAGALIFRTDDSR